MMIITKCKRGALVYIECSIRTSHKCPNQSIMMWEWVLRYLKSLFHLIQDTTNPFIRRMELNMHEPTTMCVQIEDVLLNCMSTHSLKLNCLVALNRRQHWISCFALKIGGSSGRRQCYWKLFQLVHSKSFVKCTISTLGVLTKCTYLY